MTNCRACGQTLADQSAWSALEKYQEEYFHMTAIRLSDYEDPSQAKVCDLCARKLQDFESFRQICLQVHWQLQQLVEKLEDDDSFTVAVEYLPDQDEEDPILKVFNENETADKCASVKTDSGGESDESYESDSEECYSPAKEDDDSSEDIKSEANSPIPAKKPRAKWGSRKKKEPREKRIVLSCDRCPKKFFAQYRFDAHKRAHDGLVPFECGMCDKAFARVKTLRLHRRQKHSNNPLCLPCDFPGCQHKFYTRLGFNRHKRRAHDPNYVAPPVTPFICDVCGKDFTSKGGLKTHSYTHYPDEMPFVCEVCDKKFPTVNKMKDHVLRHKGIKRHICPHCGLQKITRHELKFHIRNMHSSEPRCFPCTLCEKQLSSSGGLNTHVRTVHHGSKPHVCPFCSFAFGRTDHLKRHIRISCGVDRVGQKAVE
ncbi:zinc finger and BTB domain-containing protein 49-like isoform X2 [Sabethes cyaneus]|uniref:zinc finger and BTB domain-containing protein 49-like isoform X2 n=1 Tax=Sabethes cyaneus TaxID=53552 RepID=UPI00237E4FA6|nr:zinc finger and BTB domain-containing protein 49-like isoform X2 [Sabethes cyaneus]